MTTSPTSWEPVGYTKPQAKTGGFLSRLGGSRKAKHALAPPNTSGLAAIEGSPLLDEDEAFSPTSPDAEMPSAVALSDREVQEGVAGHVGGNRNGNGGGNGNGNGNGPESRFGGPVSYGSYKNPSPEEQPQLHQSPIPMAPAQSPPQGHAHPHTPRSGGLEPAAAADPRLSAYSNTSSLGAGTPYTDSGLSSEGHYDDEAVIGIGKLMFRTSEQYAMPSRLDPVEGSGATGQEEDGGGREADGDGQRETERYVRPARNASLMASPIARNNVSVSCAPELLVHGGGTGNADASVT